MTQRSRQQREGLLLEAMAVSDRIRNLIARNAPSAKTKKAAVEEGMLTLRRCGIGEVMAGRTSFEEVIAVTLGNS